MTEMSWTAEDRRLAEVLAADPELAGRAPLPEITEAIGRCRALSEIVETVALGYADRPALGERPVVEHVGADGRTVERPEPHHRTLTYREAWSRARAIATAWQHGPRGLLEPGDLLCSLASSSIDHNVLELAVIAAGVVSVPLATSGAVTEWTAILRETRPRALAVGVDLASEVTRALPAEVLPPTVIVLAQGRDSAVLERAAAGLRDELGAAGRDVGVHTLDELDRRGREPAPAPLFAPEPGTAPMAQILYTSGSTGSPKGAVFTEPLLTLPWRGFSQIPRPAVFLHFMPMAHINGRIALVASLARGGTCFSVGSGDSSTLLEDFALARPTEIYFVPRVCELIRDRFAGVAATREAAGCSPAQARRDALVDLRDRVLGGRVVMASNGSALLGDDVRALMEEILGVPLHEGFGTTETGSAFLVDGRVLRPLVIDYKLVDVPELGYYGTDRPYPRGELLVRTHSMISGYYGRPDLDAELFDADGYCRTGDVMAQTAPDELRFVDRRNNVVKLSQAEFVTVSRIEDALTGSPVVDQAFVHARAGRPYLVAVVVPSAAARRAHADPAALREEVVRAVRARATEAGLAPYEIPRDVVVETRPFDAAGGLLTELGKPRRPALEQRYAEELERLCVALDDRREEELAALRRDAGRRPVVETVLRAAVALTPAATTPRPEAHFAELGGDSLAALSFSGLLQDLFGVEVPVSAVVGPTATLGSLARVVESASGAVSARSVHGGRPVLHADDLTLEAFLDSATLTGAPGVASGASTAGPGAVLLTGANGFLGRFVALELLERRPDTRVVCLVRGTSDAEARVRLEAAFDTGDAALLQRFRAASRRLEVVAGDVGEPRLGLDPATWEHLAATVEQVVHPAALVNHVLPYEHVFAPNVRGTAEVVRLALTARRKSIVHVSTTGVGDQVDGPLDEDRDIRLQSPRRALRTTYAGGYANSKWAAEVLLRRAHERFGVPVTVLRSGMILAHRRYHGQLNPSDLFSRLILGVLLTGLAPRSFHEASAPGGAAPPYGALAVDVVAEATVRLGSAAGDGAHRTYNVVDPDPRGPSLDTFVDWLVDGGESITRVDDHGDWVRRFEIALRALPAEVAGSTTLPVLDAFRVPAPGSTAGAPSASRFVGAARDTGLDGTGRIPAVSRELIRKYVSDLAALGLRSGTCSGSGSARR